MTDVFVVLEPLLQTPSVVYEPHQIQVVKYGDHCRAVCELERRVDRAYTQRNNAAVALVRMALLLGWPAGRGLDDKTDSAPEWRHVVYLDIPNGEQVSYHMAPADVPLLEGLPEYAGKWDGKFTGTTAWAEMVPHAPKGRRYECGGPEFDPAEVEQLMRDVPVGEMVRYSPSEHTTLFTRAAESQVPKAPFPPGVCACPKCEQPREAGRLFCAPHRSVDSRVYASLNPITNERLAYMMQRDGEQQ